MDTTANQAPVWSPLRLRAALPSVVWRETLGGGQAFRWRETAPNLWRGQWAQHAVELELTQPQHPRWRALTPQTTERDLQRYLGEDTNWAACTDALPWRSDPVLAAAIGRRPGLRLLRQPFAETLFGFICSATKRIPQIMTAHEAVARSLGPEIAPGLHALPSWERLAEAGEAPLRACSLGYRATHLAGTAQFLAAHPGWLAQTEAAPYPEARARLMELPGVGGKVADCVLLFGAARLEAFPVDTWILQILREAYGLTDWSHEQLVQFGRLHFGPHAGLAQQFLFAAARKSQE